MPTPAFDISRSERSTTLVVRGSLDVNTAPMLAVEIDRLIADEPRQVIVDMSGVDLIDSSGVAALVKLYKGVRAAGGDVTISGARGQPLAIFKLLRLDKVFDL